MIQHSITHNSHKIHKQMFTFFRLSKRYTDWNKFRNIMTTSSPLNLKLNNRANVDISINDKHFYKQHFKYSWFIFHRSFNARQLHQINSPEIKANFFFLTLGTKHLTMWQRTHYPINKQRSTVQRFNYFPNKLKSTLIRFLNLYHTQSAQTGLSEEKLNHF